VKLLTIDNLSVSFPLGAGKRSVAVDGMSACVQSRRTLAIVGESGSGKSVTALAAMGLLPRAARVDGGSIVLHRADGTDVDLLREQEGALRAVRGKEIAMIFQEPMTSLNPVLSIFEQLEESLVLHAAGGKAGMGKAERKRRIEQVLCEVGMDRALGRLRDYPHQFSGGMRQRIMIAMALMCEPRVLLADEPTTALDVTVQAQVLGLLRSIREARGLGVVLITHDLGVVRAHADDVCVMYAGRVVEAGEASSVFARAAHPYTRALLACVPTLRGEAKEKLATVRELLEDGSEERWKLGGGAGLAWWPWRGRGSGEPRRVEVGSGHWVLAE
jgi:peptide/nickel transport system ATP-binding protein